MKFFIDTNVVIDALTERDTKFQSSKRLLYLIASKKVDGYICASQINDIYYILRKYIADQKLRRHYIKTIYDAFNVLPLLGSFAKTALSSKVNDYEDAILEEVAKVNMMGFIVTNNTKDFANSRVGAITPEQALSLIGN